MRTLLLLAFPCLLLLVGACGEPSPPVEPAATGTDDGPESRPEARPDPRLDPPRPEPDPEVDEYVLHAARVQMVDYTIASRGVKDARVLDAMRNVKRHLFVPPGQRKHAYDDRPLPIGWEQTISQPYIVGSMTAELQIEPGDKVLEIGTGSGYQAAVLAEITKHVFSIEIKPQLAMRAARALRAAGYGSVTTRQGDGYDGWAEEAPFDAIVVTAAAPHIPPPLVRQLAVGGRMVIPVGSPFAVQDLVVVTKEEDGTVRTRSLYAVRFVPLTGSLGESDD